MPWVADLLYNLFGGGSGPLVAPELPADAPVEDHNLAAFLACIRACEGTNTANGYRYLFGSTPSRELLFEDYADHPRVKTWETHDEFIANGRPDFTTAAGAYQITMTTYDKIRQRLGVLDFSPASQDALAADLIAGCGALGDVKAGKFITALRKCSGTWASLPMSQYPQPKRSVEFAKQAYTASGGTISSEA